MKSNTFGRPGKGNQTKKRLVRLFCISGELTLKLRIFPFICLLLVALHTVAMAQGTNQRPSGSTGKVKVPAVSADQRVEKFSKALGGLSPKQKVKVKASLEKYFGNLRKIAAMKNLTEAQRKAKVDAHEATFNKEVRAVLTPAQKTKFDKMIADAKKRKQSGMKSTPKPTAKAF